MNSTEVYSYTGCYCMCCNELLNVPTLTALAGAVPDLSGPTSRLH